MEIHPTGPTIRFARARPGSVISFDGNYYYVTIDTQGRRLAHRLRNGMPRHIKNRAEVVPVAARVVITQRSVVLA